MNIHSKVELASASAGRLTVIGPDSQRTILWSDLLTEAEQGAAWLQARGIGPGSVVMTAARTSLDHIRAILAVWTAGAALSVAAVPMRSRRSEALRRRFEVLRQAIDPILVLGDEDHLATLVDDADAISLTQWNIDAAGEKRVYHPGAGTPADDDVAIMQATSGTTGTPKVALIPYGCLDANHLAIVKGLQLKAKDDTFVSWLPLSHDMGLIGFLGTPMVSGANLVISDPNLFAQQPWDWMGWCSKYQATITGGPSFAYGIAATLLETHPPGDLSPLRLAMNGAEPVDVGTCRTFTANGEPYGLRPDSVFPVYGLAEATLAVTFPEIGRGLESDAVDRRRLEEGLAVPAELESEGASRQLAKLGSPLSGMEVSIQSEDGSEVGERQVGRVMMRGSSLIPGYLGEVPFAHIWFDTGDLGYIADGQLIICGRRKDVIVIGGRNIYPDEIERELAQLECVWRGNVAVFGVESKGREAVAIMAESENGGDREVERLLAHVASNWCDARIAQVRLVEPGTIPKTPSGKISRSGCREQCQMSS